MKSEDEQLQKTNAINKIKGWTIDNRIGLGTLLIGMLALLWTIFQPYILSPNICTTLKQREQQIITKIEDLNKSKENHSDSSFNEKYYEFEINYSNAELQSIRDSLKLNRCRN